MGLIKRLLIHGPKVRLANISICIVDQYDGVTVRPIPNVRQQCERHCL